jgi:transcriptional regulator with XRE-family HTH domain
MSISPQDVSARVGVRVRLLRERLGLTQQDLAERAAIDPASLSRIERGRIGLHLSTVERLAYGLGLSPAALLAEEPVQAAEADALLAELVRVWGGLPSQRRSALLTVARALSVP